jgi:KDO2-lipid IV(A) lauroyltransferase
MAPLFGRAPHTDGNLSIAARLARKARAPIVICYAPRDPDGRFRVTFLPPVYLASEPLDLLADVAALNALIEPLILAHLEQWFFLDDALE